MTVFTTKPLNEQTWPDFAALVERNNGVWGGCWCMGFHPEGVGRHKTVEQNRQEKECRVHEGRAHAALVFDGNLAVGWCQFGSPAELPRIKLKKEYLTIEQPEPDWRITCFFVDKKYRGRGVAEAALRGAIHEIGLLGGGIVESFPEDTTGRSVSGSFLYNANLEIFERLGFVRARPLGKTHWLVLKTVDPIQADG